MLPVSESAIQRMLTAANIGSACRPGKPKAGLPGWCAVHVVPIALGRGKRADMALLFEPFSGALFGEIRSTFDGVLPQEVSGREDEPEIAAFVRRSLDRLPPALAAKVTTIRLTAPEPAAGLETWYSEGARNGTVDVIPRGEPLSRLHCAHDQPTRMYDEVDLAALFGLSQIPQAAGYLAGALDAYNLAQGHERLGALRPFVLVKRWTSEGGPTFKPDFLSGKPIRLPPEIRLELAVPVSGLATEPTSPTTGSETPAKHKPAQNVSIRQRLRYGYASLQPNEGQVDQANPTDAAIGSV